MDGWFFVCLVLVFSCCIVLLCPLLDPSLFFTLSLFKKKKNYPQCLCHDHLVTIQIDAVFVSETGLNVVL